ncbi:response regulator transcription factor [Ancylobacter sp. G4_0304]|uniref:response regulator transcription factor n=1 Tax=Ancylobacter sp. G4_0304 TaxID=3114289 RepID=UPI0039C6E34D
MTPRQNAIPRLVAIVEDDASARAALASLIGAFGFEVCGFPDAASFLASRTAREAACLIADLRLPGLSGLALHYRLRAQGRHLPTILITAYPDEATRAGALRAGVRGFLEKPVEPEALLACLRAVLGISSG